MSKVQLQGNVSGTGVFTIASPNSNTDRTLTLPDVSGTIQTTGQAITGSQLPAGSILQVVQIAKTDTFTTTSASFTTITGLSTSITPLRTSSRILVLATVNGSQEVGANDAYLGLFRDSTQIALGDASGSRIRSSGQMMSANSGWSTTITLNFVDSPSTTSAITYSVRARVNASGSLYVNRGQSDADGAVGAGRTYSSLILLEIAG